MDIRTSTYDEALSDYLEDGLELLDLSIEPDHALSAFDCSEAETRGETPRVDDYPSGTWFYWGNEYVAVRMPDEDKVCRLEKRM